MFFDYKMTATERYIKENEYVSSLEKEELIIQKSESIIKSILPNWIKSCYINIKIIILYIIKDLILNYSSIKFIYKLKNSKIKSDSLLIGNGPTQDLLDLEYLQKFRSFGGEVFVVNYWNLNKKLSSFVPDYIVISDPETLSYKNFNVCLQEKNDSLLEYLKINTSIKIFIPFDRIKEIEELVGNSRVIGFIDKELRFFNGTSPVFPRGYISMTLFKALSIAIWFGYKEIFVIGMDFTYPRNYYSDINNKVLRLEVHASNKDTILDMSQMYENIGDMLKETSDLFFSLYKFKKFSNIRNLDKYSLNDAFKKVDLNYPLNKNN